MGAGFSGGPSSMQANAAAGLPFAEVPGELKQLIDEVLETEPDHPAHDIYFDHADYDRRPFGLRTFLAPHWVGLSFALLLVIIETSLLRLGPYLTQIGIDEGVLAEDTGVLFTVAVIYVVSVFLSAIASWGRTSYTGALGERLMFELRVRVFSHMQRQGLSFFTQEKAGVLMTRMTSDIEALTTLFQEGLVQFAVQFMTLLVITIYMFLLSPWLAVITIVVVVPATVGLTLWFRKVSLVGYWNVRDRIADVLSDLQESLSGIRIIGAFNRRRQNIAHHTNVIGEHRDANVVMARAQAIYGAGSEAIGIAAQAVLILVGARMVQRGDLSTGELVAFLLFLTSFFAPIQTLIQLYNQYQQGSAALAKLSMLLGTVPSVPQADNAIELPPIEGHVRLDGVTFGYKLSEPVLSGINLDIQPGEVISIVGPTGAGKSTIAKLITRFYDPHAGTVSIDGHDLRTVTHTSLRRQLGVVPQEPFLFNGTIRDNLVFARPDATDAEVTEATIATGLAEMLARLPDGVDTFVHERGSSLSAGERQLLALARAFLARPRVLILDEATSNLDLQSESIIERALDVVLEGRTAVIIAHRIATAMRADRIAVVDGGVITELGSHQELVALGGHYASLYSAWLEHAEVDH